MSNVLFITELCAMLEEKKLRGRDDDRAIQLLAKAVAPAIDSKGSN